MTDLFALTAELVDIASESFAEGPLVERLATDLARADHLEVHRIGDNLVARTQLDRPVRVILAGHTDTVPANGNARARIDGDTLWGVGSADMKGGLAVMLHAALTHTAPAVDVTYVFYAREEVASVHNGLRELLAERPDLLEGDLALLGEPTDAGIEAGCQGSVRLEVTLSGRRAHTARAWMGRNAIHRAAGLIDAIAADEPRQPEIHGCRYHEALQVVGIEGGVSGNVVPDRVTITVAHRFAPDRTATEALEHVRAVLAPHLEEGDLVEVVDVAPAAAPALDQPLVRALVARHGLEVRAKLGWTDVARFTEAGVPAANFGPGDAEIAHSPDEHVVRGSIERSWNVIDDLLRHGLALVEDPAPTP
jgi:succinyl-diaminopimelate desuccinylase